MDNIKISDNITNMKITGEYSVKVYDSETKQLKREICKHNMINPILYVASYKRSLYSGLIADVRSTPSWDLAPLDQGWLGELVLLNTKDPVDHTDPYITDGEISGIAGTVKSYSGTHKLKGTVNLNECSTEHEYDGYHRKKTIRRRVYDFPTDKGNGTFTDIILMPNGYNTNSDTTTNISYVCPAFNCSSPDYIYMYLKDNQWQKETETLLFGGMSADNDFLYIYNRGNRKIIKISRNNVNIIDEITISGTTTYTYCVVANGGKIYGITSSGSTVHEFTPSGSYVGSISYSSIGLGSGSTSYKLYGSPNALAVIYTGTSTSYNSVVWDGKDSLVLPLEHTTKGNSPTLIHEGDDWVLSYQTYTVISGYLDTTWGQYTTDRIEIDLTKKNYKPLSSRRYFTNVHTELCFTGKIEGAVKVAQYNSSGICFKDILPWVSRTKLSSPITKVAGEELKVEHTVTVEYTNSYDVSKLK